MRLFYYLIMSTVLFPFCSFAQGNLLITPIRVVFDGQKRIQELNLANTGRDTARYLVSFIEIRMNNNGTFERINEPDSGQLFASKFLRFFPRSVTLAPGEAQLVKIQLTRTSQLQPGEYRSHIYFRAVPESKVQGAPVQMNDSSGISVKLTPVFGISIPVIIRTGPPIVNVSVTDISLEHADSVRPSVTATLRRSGNHSAYGDISIDHVSEKGKVTTIGIVKGIAVYTPNQQRQFHMELAPKTSVNYHRGKLRITYTSASKDAVSDPLALAELQLH